MARIDWNEQSLDGAVHEATEEFEAQSEDSPVVEDEDGEEYVESDDVEAEPEESEESEDEPDDDEPDEAEDVPLTSALENWNGDPDALPAPAREVYDAIFPTIKKGVNIWQARKGNEYAQKAQEYERRIAELENRAREEQQKQLEPPVPKRPGENSSQEEWEDYMVGRAKREIWEAQQKQQELQPQYDPNQFALLQQQQDALRRSQMIESRPDYTEDIGAKMVEIAQANEAVRPLLSDDNGILAVFEMAKTQVEAEAHKQAAAKAHSADLQRKASAKKRKVSKPKATPKKVTPAHNYANKTLDEVVDLAFDEAWQEAAD